MREYIAGSSKGGITRRIAALDRALNVLDHLRSAMRLQQQQLASMATRMRSACILQDELRYRLHALGKQSAWWNLEWDANSGNASLPFVSCGPGAGGGGGGGGVPTRGLPGPPWP
jgi:hypothetical protein